MIIVFPIVRVAHIMIIKGWSILLFQAVNKMIKHFPLLYDSFVFRFSIFELYRRALEYHYDSFAYAEQALVHRLARKQDTHRRVLLPLWVKILLPPHYYIYHQRNNSQTRQSLYRFEKKIGTFLIFINLFFFRFIYFLEIKFFRY